MSEKKQAVSRRVHSKNAMLQWLSVDFVHVDICKKSKEDCSHVFRKIPYGVSQHALFTHLAHYRLQKFIGRGRLENSHARETSQAH